MRFSSPVPSRLRRRSARLAFTWTDTSGRKWLPTTSQCEARSRRELQDEARGTSSTRVALRMLSCTLSRVKMIKLESLWQNCTIPLKDQHCRRELLCTGVCEPFGPDKPPWNHSLAGCGKNLTGLDFSDSDSLQATRVLPQCFGQGGRRGDSEMLWRFFIRFAEPSSGWLRADREA